MGNNIVVSRRVVSTTTGNYIVEETLNPIHFSTLPTYAHNKPTYSTKDIDETMWIEEPKRRYRFNYKRFRKKG